MARPIQRSNFDAVILDKIGRGEVIVDAGKGIILGQSTDITGKRRAIGFKDKKGNCFFTFVHDGSAFTYPICRAIYLSCHKEVLPGHEVAHINEDKEDNKISNLTTRAYMGRQYQNRWTREELDFLEHNYTEWSAEKLAVKFGRSIHSVRQKMVSLRMGKQVSRRYWTQEDDKLLLSMYKDKDVSVKEIAERLGKSPASVRLRANRKFNTYRDDRLLREINPKKFYGALKRGIQQGSAWSKCCLCDYDKYIQLHHINGDRSDNHLSNIASLCPNHHTEVEHGEHKGKKLFSIWRRVYSTGEKGPLRNNLDLVSAPIIMLSVGSQEFKEMT